MVASLDFLTEWHGQGRGRGAWTGGCGQPNRSPRAVRDPVRFYSFLRSPQLQGLSARVKERD